MVPFALHLGTNNSRSECVRVSNPQGQRRVGNMTKTCILTSFQPPKLSCGNKPTKEKLSAKNASKRTSDEDNRIIIESNRTALYSSYYFKPICTMKPHRSSKARDAAQLDSVTRHEIKSDCACHLQLVTEKKVCKLPRQERAFSTRECARMCSKTFGVPAELFCGAQIICDF